MKISLRFLWLLAELLVYEKSLFKYLSLKTDDNLDWVCGYLRGRIYYSSPLGFNDPFEISTKLDNPTADDLAGMARNDEIFVSEYSKSGQRKILQKLKMLYPSGAERAVSAEWLQEFGILCLSEKWNSLLMWAHYASEHTGVCIGFDSDFLPFSSAKKVIYDHVRPSIPFSCVNGVSEVDLDKIFLRKSKEWEYESEWRIIKRNVKNEERDYYYKRFNDNPEDLDEVVDIITSNAGPGIYDYDTESIRSLYLGSKISRVNKEKILDVVRSEGLRVRVLQVGLDTHSYSLTYKKLALC